MLELIEDFDSPSRGLFPFINLFQYTSLFFKFSVHPHLTLRIFLYLPLHLYLPFSLSSRILLLSIANHTVSGGWRRLWSHSSPGGW